MTQNTLILQKRELEERLNQRYLERRTKANNPESNLIKVIIGPRRAGKSFFAMHLLRNLGNFAYVNFDDEKLVTVKDYDEIFSSLRELYNNPTYFLFDEIQNLDKWELFVNRLQRQGYNLFITGSNSNLLSKEFATHLTGRYLEIIIFPFSFKEYLSIESKELAESEIKARFESYLQNGGYPQPLIENMSHKEYLSTLFDAVLYKDIVKRFKIRDVSAIEDLALYLLSNSAKEFSYTTLSKVTKCKNVRTVQKYLSYLEEAFMLFSVKRFSFKLKEQMGSNKKIYSIDNGFISTKAFRLSPDKGRLYENLAAIALKKKEVEGKLHMYYWKNAQQEEVDFVVKEGLHVTQLIQVYSGDDPKEKEREIRALLKAGKEFSCSNLLVITEDYGSFEDVEWFGMKGRVMFIPLWKWLLAPEP